MNDVTIRYNGANITTMDTSGTIALQTQGKYCENDISVTYVKTNGGSGTDLFPIPEGYSLPSNYKKLAYCDSDGSQICDSGVHPTLNTKVEFAGYFIPGNYNEYEYLFGCNKPSIYVATNGYDGTIYWGFGNKSDFWSLTYYSQTDRGIPLYTISAAEGRVSTDPFPPRYVTCGATSLPGLNPSTTIGIMGRIEVRALGRLAPCRFFRARIWEDNTLVRCIFPVLKDGNEVCLYDVVNGIYMPNIGSGALVGVM